MANENIQEAFGAAYQIISALAGECGKFGSPAVLRILDYFHDASCGKVEECSKVLPFSIETTMKPVRTDADHQAVLDEINSLMGAPKGSPEHDRMEVLGILALHYAEKRWPAEGDSAEIKMRLRIANETLIELQSRMSGLEKRLNKLQEIQAKISEEN